MPTVSKHYYKSSPVPPGLSFDEASLFWRLRMGEGVPSRKWHKPLDRSKTWHEIKAGLDQKIEDARTSALFQKTYPSGNSLKKLIAKWIRILKQSFLLE